jgi:hypothetical protein
VHKKYLGTSNNLKHFLIREITHLNFFLQLSVELFSYHKNEVEQEKRPSENLQHAATNAVAQTHVAFSCWG